MSPRDDPPHCSVNVLLFKGWANSEEGCNLRKHRAESEQVTAELHITAAQPSIQGTHHTAAGTTATCIKKSSS